MLELVTHLRLTVKAGLQDNVYFLKLNGLQLRHEEQ